MKITIHNVYGDYDETFQGEPDDVRKRINARFSFLAKYGHKSLQEDIRRLANTQALFVSVEE
jgi:hypothetical protein